MKILKDISLIISNGSPVALARRDEETKNVIFYELHPMDLDSVEKLLNKINGNNKGVPDGNAYTDSGV